MASPNGYTYDDASVREDLLNVLTNLSPKNTQLVSGLGQSTASSIRHEWLIKTLGTVKNKLFRARQMLKQQLLGPRDAGN